MKRRLLQFPQQIVAAKPQQWVYPTWQTTQSLDNRKWNSKTEPPTSGTHRFTLGARVTGWTKHPQRTLDKTIAHCNINVKLFGFQFPRQNSKKLTMDPMGPTSPATPIGPGNPCQSQQKHTYLVWQLLGLSVHSCACVGFVMRHHTQFALAKWLKQML